MLLALSVGSIAFSACDPADRSRWGSGQGSDVQAERMQDADARRRGAALFSQHCALCHGERGDGRGIRQTGFGRRPANLRDPGWRAGATPRRVFHTIRNGIPAGGMPAWRSLEEEETWDLVAYVLSLAEDGR